mmetsp:Transcript_21788/g.48808  ORF Transcript_21788/g.48808 Transcript_21788/m.48808 type:complete len:190 (+) Transcript_21788:2734-3303(+)
MRNFLRFCDPAVHAAAAAAAASSRDQAPPGGASSGGYPYSGSSTDLAAAAPYAGGNPAPVAAAASRPAGGEPTEADLLCSEFLVLVRQRTREGYQEALRLAKRILQLEPGNKMVQEYEVAIETLLAQMDAYVDEVEEAAQDPNRTPSEVSTEDSESEQSSVELEDGALEEDHVSEVATEPSSPVVSPRG